MFNFSFGELLVIGVIALLVLGPDKLPGAARTAGVWIGKIKRTVGNLQHEITSQLEAEDLRRELSKQGKRIDGGVNRARKGFERFTSEFNGAASSSSRQPPLPPSRPEPPPAPAEVRAAPLPPLRPPSRPVIARAALDAPLPTPERSTEEPTGTPIESSMDPSPSSNQRND